MCESIKGPLRTLRLRQFKRKWPTILQLYLLKFEILMAATVAQGHPLSGSCGRLSRCQLVPEAGMIGGRKGAFVRLAALGHGPVLGPGDTHVFIFFYTKGLVATAIVRPEARLCLPRSTRAEPGATGDGGSPTGSSALSQATRSAESLQARCSQNFGSAGDGPAHCGPADARTRPCVFPTPANTYDIRAAAELDAGGGKQLKTCHNTPNGHTLWKLYWRDP